MYYNTVRNARICLHREEVIDEQALRTHALVCIYFGIYLRLPYLAMLLVVGTPQQTGIPATQLPWFQPLICWHWVGTPKANTLVALAIFIQDRTKSLIGVRACSVAKALVRPEKE